MSGTHYTLDRDRKNPMETILSKACKKCGTVKDNTFAFFGKKWWRTRTEYTTVDVCSDCVRASLTARHAERREAEMNYRRMREAERTLQMEEILRAKREANEKGL